MTTVQTEKKRVPELRFPEFNGDWETKSLNSFLKQSKAKNRELEFDKSQVLSVTAEIGVVNQIEYHGRSYAGVSVAPYGIVRKGEMVYTKSPLRDYPYGIIKLNEHADGVVSTLYAIYTLKDNVSGKFLDHYFYHPHRINRYLKPLVNIGAKNDMKVNNDYAISDPITIPSLPEQEKIATFLTSVDTRIRQLTRKVELLEQYKKGVMQKIFSQEIRFKDDQGHDFPDWGEKQLGDIVERVIKKNRDAAVTFVLTNSATEGIVSQQEYFNKGIANPDNLSGYYIVQKDDFVYNPRISSSAPVGPIKRNKLGKGVMSPLYTVFRFKKHSLDFYERYFESSQWYRYMKSIANYGARHDRMNITNSDFLKMPMPAPVLEEQQKIAAFLTAIDQKVTNTKDQLDQMRTFKKGLLQKMFV